MKYLIQHFIEDTLRECASQTAIKQGDREFTYAEIDDLSLRYQTYFSEKLPFRQK